MKHLSHESIPGFRAPREVPPTLFVPGAGILPESVPTEATWRRAEVAARLIASHNITTAILSGGHTNVRPERFVTSEAQVMQEHVISTLLRLSASNRTQLVKETTSFDTWSNFFNSADLIDKALAEAGVDTLGLVAGKDHLPRVRQIGRRVLGSRIELVPIATETTAPTLAVAKETALRGLIHIVGRRDTPGDRQAAEATADRYRHALELPKRHLARLFPNY